MHLVQFSRHEESWDKEGVIQEVSWDTTAVKGGLPQFGMLGCAQRERESVNVRVWGMVTGYCH